MENTQNIKIAVAASRLLEIGITHMKYGDIVAGEPLIREAFDSLVYLIDDYPRCDQFVNVGEDYSGLPWDYLEQHQKNQADPEKKYVRHPYGVTNTGFNLDSGYVYLYTKEFQCSLRHGHAGSCKVSQADREKLASPKRP